MWKIIIAASAGIAFGIAAVVSCGSVERANTEPATGTSSPSSSFVTLKLYCSQRDQQLSVEGHDFDAVRSATAHFTELRGGTSFRIAQPVALELEPAKALAKVKAAGSAMCRSGVADEITLSLGFEGGTNTAATAWKISLAGGNPCIDMSERMKSCWLGADCSRIADATGRTVCEAYVNAFKNPPVVDPATVLCEGSALAAAEACTTLKPANVDAQHTAHEVSQYCSCGA